MSCRCTSPPSTAFFTLFVGFPLSPKRRVSVHSEQWSDRRWHWDYDHWTRPGFDDWGREGPSVCRRQSLSSHSLRNLEDGRLPCGEGTEFPRCCRPRHTIRTPLQGTSSGPIRISVGRSSARTAESSQLYSFVETNVFSVYPSYAPVSGGTKVVCIPQLIQLCCQIDLVD